jgi:CHAD domain-containing protein
MVTTDLQGAFRKRLDAFSHELGRVEDGDVEALHRTRVASRRLREFLPLLGLDRERNLTRRLQKVTKQLGTVRELDVLMILVQELGDDGRYSTKALKQLGDMLAQARAAARERLSAKLPAAKLERLARKLDRVSKGLDSDGAGSTGSNRHDATVRRRAWLWALEARLARRATQVLAAIEVAGAMYVPEHLHRVRIAVKKLRYAGELVAETTRKRIAVDIAALKAAQDLLGRLHDLEMLLVSARKAQASLAPPDLTAWRHLGSLVHVIEDDCRQLHARYMRDRTELMAMANRMAAGTRDAQPVARRTAV